MAVGFAHLFKTDPLGDRFAFDWQILTFVLVFGFFRFFFREWFNYQRIVDVQRFICFAFRDNTENIVQFFRRYLPGVFGYTCRSKDILFFCI